MIFESVGIVLVIVTLSAADCGTHPDSGQITDPVGGVDGVVFLGLDATFVGSLQQAVVPRGDFLPFAAVIDQVAGELLPGELVERHILVKGANHIVAIGGDVVILVSMVAHRVSESDEVEPVDGEAFPEVGRVEQLIDQFGPS